MSDASGDTEPYALLDADETDDEEPIEGGGPCFSGAEAALAGANLHRTALSLGVAGSDGGAPQRLMWEAGGAPPTALGRQLAFRVLRDAIGLQLARRGFDGLRQAALWLATELAADFLRALGAQLQRVACPLAVPSVPRAPSSALVPITTAVQRAANLRNPAEWQHLLQLFMLVAEPAIGTGGSHRPPEATRAGALPLPPPSVAPLYAAMKSAWNYKQTGTGRAAHTTAGAAEVPTANGGPGGGPLGDRAELSVSLRLGKRQRQLTDAWLQASQGSLHSAPVLLPGAPLGGGGGDAAGGGVGGGDVAVGAAGMEAGSGGKGRGRKRA